MNGTQISFDGYSLQTPTIFTSQIDHASIPTLNASIFALSHGNQSVISYTDYPSKTITVSGKLVTASIFDLDNLIDTFKSYFNGRGKYLDIGYAGGIRRYIASVNAVTVSRPNGLSSASFELEFIALRPFGQDVLPTTAINVASRTGASYNDSVTFAGSAPYQYPIRTVTYSAIGDNSVKTVSFGNNANGQQINVSRIWSANDTFAVDVFKKEVTVNGNPVDYSGAFPEFVPGVNSVYFGDTFSSRTFSDNMVYYKAWL